LLRRKTVQERPATVGNSPVSETYAISAETNEARSAEMLRVVKLSYLITDEVLRRSLRDYEEQLVWIFYWLIDRNYFH
jgi:hypothetical protein